MSGLKEIALLLELKQERIKYWEKHGTIPSLQDLLDAGMVVIA